MKILAAGGGSGGHVIPVVAVFKEIIKTEKSNEIELRFWCDQNFSPQARKIMKDNFADKVKVSTIISGKFRRYNNLTFWQHFTIVNVVFGNFIDLFKNFFGLIQSVVKLIFWRPNVIFCKGGFTCVPIGLAAWILQIPVVIHDSDAHPGLANRILAKFAKKIATGAPLKYYNYPEKITKYVGIPVSGEFQQYSKKQRDEFKQQLGFSLKSPLIVITGGGLGAERLNNSVVAEAHNLTKICQIALISGSNQFEKLKNIAPNDENFHLFGFISNDMWKMLAAADIVVARAGATSNLELASLAKPTILVPNAQLTGGHQLKNAKVYADSGAVEVIDDTEMKADPTILTKKINELINNPGKLEKMGEKFKAFSKPNAAREMAKLILSEA